MSLTAATTCATPFFAACHNNADRTTTTPRCCDAI